MFMCWWNHLLNGKTFVPGNTTELKPGGLGVDVMLQILSGRDIILELHTKVDIVSAANKVPLMLTPDVFEKNVPR